MRDLKKKKGGRLDVLDGRVFPYQQVPNYPYLEQKLLSWVRTRHAKMHVSSISVAKKAPELGYTVSQALVFKSSSRLNWKFGSNWIVPIGKI